MIKLSTFIVALLLLLPTRIISPSAPSATGGWQGYGNMSSSNLTIIFDYVNANISTALVEPITFCTQFSTYLNSKWDPAWNVFFLQSTKDAVVYGYAFRNHWMWYNGYITNGQTVGFILWKDYNCKVWQAIGKGITSTFSGQLTNSLIGLLMSAPPNMNDIWGAAFTLMDSLAAHNSFKNQGYSIVASQQDTLPVNGYVCTAGNVKTHNRWAGDYKGSFVIFQTR